MAYGTADELRDRTQLQAVVEDSILVAIIAAAERNINRACNRPDGFEVTEATARVYTGLGKAYLLIDECCDIDLVAVKESFTATTYTAWATGDWIACSGDPRSPDFNSSPYDMLIVDPTGNESRFTSGVYQTKAGVPTVDVTHGVPTVQVTAYWGYSFVAPADIREACLMQSARWYKRYQSAMSDTLASGELGTLLYRLSLDPDIRRLLIDGRYMKPVIGRR